MKYKFLTDVEQWEARERAEYLEETLDLWRGLDKAAARRDIFWILYYADQLSTHASEFRSSHPQNVIL